MNAIDRIRKLALRVAGFVRANEAAAAVEFALLSPAIIALILVGGVVGVVFMAKSELDAATDEVARMIMTGQITTSSQLQTQLCNNIGGIFSCSALIVSLNSYSSLSSMSTSTPTLTYNGSGVVTNSWNTNFGSHGSIMVLQVMYQYPMISGELFSFGTQTNGTNLMISTAVFVNE